MIYESLNLKCIRRKTGQGVSLTKTEGRDKSGQSTSKSRVT